MSDKRNILSNRKITAILGRLDREIASTCRKVGVDNKLTATIHVSDIGTSIAWHGCNCPTCAEKAITALARSLGAHVVSDAFTSSDKQVH